MPDFSAYQPSKTAVNRFAEFVNAQYGDKGVRAFAYHPGTCSACLLLVLRLSHCVGVQRPGGVLTRLAAYGMPQDLLGVLHDTPELAAGFCVWLSAPAKYADADFFKGRWVMLTPSHGTNGCISPRVLIVTADTFLANGTWMT